MASATQRAKQARAELENWLSQKPAVGSTSYDSALDEAIAALAGGSFAGNYTAGTDQNARDYQQNYRASANQAASLAAAQTKALSGGYGANYADSAAAQAAQLQSQWARSAEPMFRSMAGSAYNANAASDQAAVAGMLAGQQLENSAQQLAYNDWAMQRDELAAQEQQAAAEADSFWAKVLDGILWAAQAGLDVYDAYKGYTQQEWENDFALKQWEAEQAQREAENQRYAAEYADSRADIAWQQSITEQELAAKQTAAEDEHALSQAQLALLQKQLAGGGSGSSGGLSSSGSSGGTGLPGGMSYSEWLKIADALDSALYSESVLAPYYAQLLGIDPAQLTEEEPVEETPAGYAERAAARQTPTAEAFGQTVVPYMGLMDPAYLELMLGSGSQDAQQAADYAGSLLSQGMGKAAIRSRLIQMGYTEAQAQAIVNTLG